MGAKWLTNDGALALFLRDSCWVRYCWGAVGLHNSWTPEESLVQNAAFRAAASGCFLGTEAPVVTPNSVGFHLLSNITGLSSSGKSGGVLQQVIHHLTECVAVWHLVGKRGTKS